MANTIRLRRGSTAPTAGSFVEGEPAWDSTNKKLYVKAADGTMAQVGASGVSDGDKGDITVSASGATWTIDNQAVTYAKLQNVSATDKLLGRSTAGAGSVEEITCTAAGRALIDDADAAAQRTTLGLGTLATQNGTFSGTSSGTNTGDQTITLTGDVTGSGTGSFAATLANTAVAPGSYTYTGLTVDNKGRITAASSGTPVTSFSAGTTGLTPSTGTTGAVTLAGTLAVANGGTGVTTSTGTGSVVLSTSPSLTTPVLGTPTSGTLTNCTGYTFANLASKPTTLSGYGITDAATSTHTHGNISTAGAIGTTANLPVITTTSGVLTTGTFGTTASTFCQGNDSRLSDTRTPTDGTVTDAKVASNAAIAYSKLAALTSGNILVGNATNVATSVAVTGDVTISNAGVTSIGSGVIVNADVSASAAIAGTKISPDFGSQAITTSGNYTAANQADVLFAEATANGTNTVGFQAPASIASNVVWTLPAADGTSGQVITTNGSGALSFATPNSGLVYLTTITASGATTVDFTSTSVTGYDSYKIIGSNIDHSSLSNTTDWRLRTSSDGGSTFAITTSSYDYSRQAISAGVITSASSTTSFVLFSTHVGGSQLNFEMTAWDVSNTSDNKQFYINAGYISSSGTYTNYLTQCSRLSTSIVNGFRFYNSNSYTFSGTFTLYGLRRA